MLVTIIYSLSVILFCAAFYFTKLIITCNKVIEDSQDAIRIVSNKNLDDHAKEKLIQAAAIKMLKASFTLLFKILITLVLATIPLWIADVANVAPLSQTSEYALRIDVLVITTLIITALVFLYKYFIKKTR